jgi:hypothetical protein
MSDKIVLSDRIKELSYTVGTGNVSLEGAANGFSDFASKYVAGDTFFYAITDGTRYEIGSGVYGTGITGDYLIRFPFRSSSNDDIVSFPAGTKEVFVTYPATHAVFQGSGLYNLSIPKSSGLAFWANENTLDYDSNIVWDKENNKLGINTNSPQHSIDIGGDAANSIIRSSGVVVGTSGIQFPANPNYDGGRQTVHYEQNQLDQYAYDNELLNHLTGSNAVLELSGVVNQYILFKQQDAGTVFAGPASGCTPPCSPAYPSFRQLVLDDFPYLEQVSGILNTRIVTVSGMFVSGSGALNDGINTVSGMFVSGSGALNNYISLVSGISNINNSSIITVSGMFVSGSGALDNKINTVSGILNNDVENLETSFSQAVIFLQGQLDNIDANVSASTAGSGITYTSSNNALHLDDPTTDYSTLSSTNSKAEDKLLVWRESNNRWYNMSLGNILFAPSGNSYIKYQTINNTSDQGQLGQVAYDDSYMYFYTSTGWKRINTMETFGSLTTTSTTAGPTTTTTTNTSTTPSPFNTVLTIDSGETNKSGGGLTFYGAEGSVLSFNALPSITNPLAISEIRIYISGSFLYRITLYTEIVTANGPFRLVTDGAVSYDSTFGAGTDEGSYRRIDL